MTEMLETVSELEQICQQQCEEIEKQKVQIWDLEEELRVLSKKPVARQETIDKQTSRINELEAWCTHLQKSLDKEKDMGILYWNARRIKRMFVKK